MDIQQFFASPFSIFLLVACVFGVIAYYSWYLEKKRREAMAAAAAQVGFTYEPASAGTPGDTFGSFHLFNQGHSRSYANILRGPLSAETQALLFDYTYVTGSGKNRSTHHQSVAALYDSRAHFPGFELRPEHVFHKIGSLFGYQDLDFGFNPKFSGEYLLRGHDEAAIRNLFGPTVLSYFENNTGWCIEGGGDCIAVYRAGKRIEPEEVPSHLDRLRTLFFAFPR